MDVIVTGSKNGFLFGPVEVYVDNLEGEAEKAAVLDAILAAEDSDGIDMILQESQRSSEKNDVRSHAVGRGFTALSFKHKDNGSVIHII
jgi:hypothetical protein